MAKILTRSAKNKGARLQKWVIEKVSEVTGIKSGKDELISSRPMGQSGTDVVLIGEAKKLFPFSVECKNQETFHFIKWMEQAKANQLPDTDWMLVMSKNNFKPIVTLSAEKFFEIYKKSLA